MIDRVLGFSVRACFAMSILLFLLRLFGIVSPYSRACLTVNWAFFWAFGLAIILLDVLIVRQSHSLVQARTAILRWVYSIGKFLALLILGAFIFLTMCVGMNFMGQ